ncbi:tail tube protein [Rhizobium phage RHph_N34]|uniref:Putative baseplate tail tube initiator protein n=1 Tax=Rhizobium phage RHph_N34 TaxID=2509586 RepID=A0A7S5R9Z8_9CAUD|nr:tail tube protein [Rhizobium phage RHph_N34]QIG73862.1 putative baseplate tail tube initiator protein [Rhizobium phage RHph_N34]
MNQDMINLLVSSGGFSRTNNYKVELVLPPGLDGYQDDLEMIDLSCSGAEIPGVALDTWKIHNGPSLEPEQANSSYQQNIDLLFYVSKSFVERLLFKDWMNLAVDDVTRVVGYYDDYVGEVIIWPMKRGNDPESSKLIGCRLTQAYPKFVGKIQYAYGAEGEIAMLPVTFTYYNHEFI